jgi:hypothetical protein
MLQGPLTDLLHRWRHRHTLIAQDLESELYTDMYYIHLLEQALQHVLPRTYEPFSTPIEDDEPKGVGKGGAAKSRAHWA